MADPNFPQVEWLSNLEPWSSPTFMPGAPHNLPKRPEPGQTTTENAGLLAPGESLPIRDSYRYASLVTANTAVGTTSFKFLDQPIGKRNFLGLRNASTGTQVLYVEFNSQATAGTWLAINPGTIVLFDTVVPQDDLYVISSAANGILAYAYSTFPG
jgi:hypothetical protein